MYLNIGSECMTRNEIIDNINGTNILLYGHVKERFEERVIKLKDELKINELNYDYLVQEGIQAIKEKYDECIIKQGNTPVWKTVEGEFDIICDKVKYTIEVTVLLKSTRVVWKSGILQRVADDYYEYVNNGIVKENDIVIALETIVMTIKTADEKRRLNFTDFEVVRKINTKKKCIRITPIMLRELCPNYILYHKTLCTAKARELIKNTLKNNNLLRKSR